MSFLKNLLDGADVEWKILGEMSNVLRGKRLTRSQLSKNEKYPVFHGGLEPLGYYEKSNRPSDTVMIINVGASAGTVGYSAVDFWSSDGCYCIEHSDFFNGKFLYYVLVGYQRLLRSKVRVAGIPTLDAVVVGELPIPIPCPENPKKSLAIQAEIVRILDAFAELTAELAAGLTAELTARGKQYHYYRGQLLSFHEGEVEWMPLGSLCNSISSGRNKKKSAEGAYPVYGSTAIIGQTDEYSYDEKQILVARVGANAGYVHLADGKYDVSDNTIIINVKDKYSLKFIFHILTNMDLRQYAKGAGQPLITSGDLKELKVPVPYADNPEKSLAEQARIAATLDKFDALTKSLQDGLPREIALREKQYESYRNLLLSFPKPEGGAA